VTTPVNTVTTLYLSKMHETSQLLEELLSSQEGLCSSKGVNLWWYIPPMPTALHSCRSTSQRKQRK